jgi:hypothetical protein
MPRSFTWPFTFHGPPPRSPGTVLARCATQQHKYWPILLAWAQQHILSRNPPDEVGKRHAARLADQPTSLELFSPPLAVSRRGEVPGRVNHVTHLSPLGVSSHQVDVQIVEAKASRSCTPRVHTVPDITCTEHPSKSAGQGLPGNCLGTTSSHDLTFDLFNKTFIFAKSPTQSVHVHRTRKAWTLSVVGRGPSIIHLYV